MASESSSSPSSSVTELADPNTSPDRRANLESVGDQLASMGLAEPSEISDGSHTEDGGRSPEEEDDDTEIASANGDGERIGVAEELEGAVWLTAERTVEMEVVEEPESPTSSGYVGERGSSDEGTTSTSRAVDDDANDDEIQEGKVDGEGRAPWLPGKRHVDEDDASVSWRKRKKHFFILSHSGKPIYSRYGDEHKLAGFSATLQAIISFVENGGDRVNLVKAGKHQVVFLVKGPIYLVCISCTDETYESLRGQLDLLYGQMILILTKSINRCFEKNPKFDMTLLLGGTDVVFSSLIHSFNWNPAAFLHAYTCLPLSYATRQVSGAILQDVCGSNVLFALLMCGHKVISLVGAQKASIHPDDLLLLSNFIMSSESFRTSESFSPICLPRYNPLAFLHAYVHFFDDDTYVTLLTTRSDAFYHLKDCRILIEDVLLKSNVLSEVQRSIMEGGMRVEDLPVERRLRHRPSSTSQQGQGINPHDAHAPERFREATVGTGGPAGLWHFIYRSFYLDQYVSSEFSPPITSHRQQKSLYRAYQKLYASMHEKGLGPHKTHYRRDENYALLCWVTPDFELYAAFDPLVDKALAIKICNRVCQWVKDVEKEIFLQGASPFSW
ncbi:PREDICTED: protein SAND [Tarenaya hassleriana]|uniref:protein SAND n=1 Tax=Tarenaya hassleriana TaxID=28532 RepID=UPI00053C4070|nr:PREDICTED: protein SAND [Tarenaya hassleriana]